jgi:leader peptidase (prepilin peptidase)/N-methyltransferase
VIPAPPGAAAAAAILLGLVFGSFANVCIHRLPEGASVVAPRSRCPSCGALIRWYDNVPILSWILLRARCRACGGTISRVYPAVEAAVGIGFLAAYLLHGVSLDAAAAAWMVFACVVLTVVDVRHFILPDAITLPGLGLGLLVAALRALAPGAEAASAGFWGGPLDEPVLPLASLAGAAAGAAVPLAARAGYGLVRRLRGGGVEDPAPEPGGAAPDGGPGPEQDDDVASAALREGMGLGDVKMLAMVGAFLGARLTLVAILVGSIAGCLTVLPWLLATRRSLKTPIPFGPFIAAGALVAVFAGEPLASGYTRLLLRVLH